MSLGSEDNQYYNSNNGRDHDKQPPQSHEKLSPLSSSSSGRKEGNIQVHDDDDGFTVKQQSPPVLSPLSSSSLYRDRKKKVLMTRQLSMRESSLEVAWEKRRRRFLKEEAEAAALVRQSRSLTDYDLKELKGSIELGFGFNEEDGGHHLLDTLPALDLYFAVNRNLSSPPTPSSSSSRSDSMSSSSFGSPSPRSPHHIHDPWKICNPGDNPEDVKTRLRHWAQAVACSVKQCH